MIPEEVATMIDMMVQGYGIDEFIARRLANDIYNEFLITATNPF